MVIMTAWRDVRGGQRVLLTSGRIVHILPRVDGLPGIVGMRNEHGSTRVVPVDAGQLVPVVIDQEDVAVANLTAAFGSVEYLGKV